MSGDCIRCGIRNRIDSEELCLKCILELYQLKVSEYNDLRKELGYVKNKCKILVDELTAKHSYIESLETERDYLKKRIITLETYLEDTKRIVDVYKKYN